MLQFVNSSQSSLAPSQMHEPPNMGVYKRVDSNVPERKCDHHTQEQATGRFG